MKTITLTKAQGDAIRADRAIDKPKAKPHAKPMNNWEPKYRGLHSEEAFYQSGKNERLVEPNKYGIWH